MSRSAWIVLTQPDKLARGVLAKAIKRAGHEVVECASGIETLLEVAKWPPEVLVIDDSVSDLSLDAIVQAVRSRPDGASIGIIALLHGEGIERIPRFEGVDVCVTKPVKDHSLVKAIRDLIEPEPEPAREAVPAG